MPVSTLDGFDVLLAEDDPDARELYELVLREYGAHVRAASNAGEAISLLEERRPGVLISDIGMPGEDGHSLLRRVHAIYPDLPAIAVTGYAAKKDVDLAFRAGFRCVLTKPMECEELVAAVFRFAERPRC